MKCSLTNELLSNTMSVVIFFSAFIISLLPTPYPLPPVFAEDPKIVAQVNGAAITEVDLEGAIDTYVPPGGFHGGIGSDKRKEFREPALNMLVDNELLFQEAKKKGVTVEEERIDAIVAETEKRYKNKKTFEAALETAGLTRKDFEKMVERNETIKNILKAETEEKARYTEKELEGYYAVNRGRFVRPEGFRIRHMLIQSLATVSDKEKRELREKAEGLLKRVKAGEDFADLAYKHSEDAFRVKGGDLGWVHKGRLEPALEEAVFKMQVGEAVMVETVYGFHIIRLEEKKPSEQLSFEDVKSSLKKDLEAKRSKELKEALLKRLREKAKIEMY